eukprot:Rmarinus@m.11335
MEDETVDVTVSVVIFGAIAAFVLAWANAANDIGNAVGTAVGAKVLTLRQAILWGCVFEFAGGVLMGTEVAKSIGGKMVDEDDFKEDPELYAVALVCVLTGAGLSTLLATFFGVPVSATHAIVSAVITATVMTHGWSAVDGGELGFTISGWVLSPALGVLLSYGMVIALYKLIFCIDSDSKRIQQSKNMQPVLMSFTVFVVSLFLMLKGPHFLHAGYVISPLAALGCAALTYMGMMYYRKKYSGYQLLHGESSLVEPTLLDHDGHIRNANDLESPVDEYRADFDPKIDEQLQDEAEEYFRYLVMVTALVVAFSHGANDLGNSVGPFSKIIEIYDEGQIDTDDDTEVPFYVLVAGAASFCIGIVTLGYKTIKTVSENITRLTPHLAFCSQLATAISVLASSAVGLPVSTSHCLVGAVIGTGLGQRACGKPVDLNLVVLKRIVLTWIITIPASAAITAALYGAVAHDDL